MSRQGSTTRAPEPAPDPKRLDPLLEEITDPKLAILVSSIGESQHQGEPLRRGDYALLYLCTIGLALVLIIIGSQL